MPVRSAKVLGHPPTNHGMSLVMRDTHTDDQVMHRILMPRTLTVRQREPRQCCKARLPRKRCCRIVPSRAWCRCHALQLRHEACIGQAALHAQEGAECGAVVQVAHVAVQGVWCGATHVRRVPCGGRKLVGSIHTCLSRLCTSQSSGTGTHPMSPGNGPAPLASQSTPLPNPSMGSPASICIGGDVGVCKRDHP